MANVTSRGQSAMQVAPIGQRPLGLAKGQSAMEFLMTYGWAILVLIIVIAVLFYMGIFNPQNVQPDVCSFAPGFSCYSFVLSNGTGALALDFGQALGKQVLVTNISCAENITGPLDPLDHNISIPSGYDRWIVGGDSGNAINCTDENGNDLSADASELGKRYKGVVCVGYQEARSGINKTVCGELAATFSSGITGGDGGGGETPLETPTPEITPTPTPFCNMDETCDHGEDCSCADCDGQQDGCDTGYVCNEGDCMAQSTPTPTPEPTATPTPTPEPTGTPIGSELGSCAIITEPGIYTIAADFNASAPVSCSAGYGENACICMEVEDVSLDCQQRTIDASASGFNGVGIIANAHSEIKNCRMNGEFSLGILVKATYSNVNITGNTITDSYDPENYYAVMQLMGSDLNVAGNTINDWAQVDLYTYDSYYTSNAFEAGTFGMAWLRSGTGNTFSGNNFAGGSHGLGCQTSAIPAGSNIDAGGNTCSGPSASCYWATGSCEPLPDVCGNGQCVYNETQESCCIDCGCPGGLNCMSNECTANTTITGCTFITNPGTYILSPSFTHNTAPYCGGHGNGCICLNSTGVTIDCQNNVLDVQGDRNAISDGHSMAHGDTVTNCIIQNAYYGITSYSAINVINNTFSNFNVNGGAASLGGGNATDNKVSNTGFGINIQDADGSTIARNTVTSASGYGISLYNSDSSTIRDNDVRGAATGFYCNNADSNTDGGGNQCNTQNGCSAWLTSCP